MPKDARPDHAIHELIASRWSPYGFDDRPVSAADLRSLLEAARWAPSSYNEQPWSFLVATRAEPDAFSRGLSCLVEANQEWAQTAPVLVICCTRLRFTRNDKPNAAAVYDLGLAAATLSLEATARGLSVHQMIGISAEKAREVFEIPADVVAVTAMAIGYAADPDHLPEKFQQRDQSPRDRKSLSEFVFSGKWGTASALMTGDDSIA